MATIIEQFVPKATVHSLQEELDALKEAAKEMVLAVEEWDWITGERPTRAINRVRELLGMECWT